MAADDIAPLQIGDFDRIDATADPARYVEWMNRQRGDHRDRALSELAIGRTDVVLDLGCGTGVDLGSDATDAGAAVGIDVSPTMAVTTRSKVPNAPVSVSAIKPT